LVLVDRFNDKGNLIDSHLREKFSVGITGLPFTPQHRLESILGFHYSSVGQSHFPSLVDIVLGSLRFAINAHTRDIKGNIDTAIAMLKLIEPMFIRSDSDSPILELSFQFSPKAIIVDAYRKKYDQLKEFLASA